MRFIKLLLSVLTAQELYDRIHQIFPYYPETIDYVETEMIKGNHLYRISLSVAGANKIEILMFRDLKKQQE